MVFPLHLADVFHKQTPLVVSVRIVVTQVLNLIVLLHKVAIHGENASACQVFPFARKQRCYIQVVVDGFRF